MGSLNKLEPVVLVMHGAIAMLFLAMWFDDSGDKRKYYFIAYTSVACFSLVALMLFLTGMLGKDQDVEVLAERVCKAMSDKELKEMHYKNQDQCQEGMTNMLWWVLVFMVPTIVIVQVHFCLVLYTHWLNTNRSKEQGGLASNEEGAPFADQMDVHDDGLAA